MPLNYSNPDYLPLCYETMVMALKGEAGAGEYGERCTTHHSRSQVRLQVVTSHLSTA
ncbi:MAG: hypothetical protein MZV63_48050 [Marinilabiliales bacterium]|nr:hypothetical protein [Marinilabiliales bacterium]